MNRSQMPFAHETSTSPGGESRAATKGVVCGCGMGLWVVFETIEIVENPTK